MIKLNIQKTKIMASGPITSWEIDGETVETMRVFWGAPKSLQMVPNLVFVVSSPSHVRLSCDPWTVAHQAALSMGFSRQEYWNGLPFPSPGDLPTQGLNQCLLLGRWMWFNSWVRKIPGEGTATHSSILAWRVPWTEEPGRLLSTGLHRVRHDLVTDE